MTARTAHGALWAATALPALAVAALPGAPAAARAALGFSLAPPPPSLAETIGIATTNARVAGAILLAAVAVASAPAIRRLLDAMLVLVLTPNAVLVGVALGAYGAAAIPFLVHLPLEWIAIGNAVSAYLRARRGGDRLRPVAADVLRIGAVLAAAAWVEVWLTPRG